MKKKRKVRENEWLLHFLSERTENHIKIKNMCNFLPEMKLLADKM